MLSLQFARAKCNSKIQNTRKGGRGRETRVTGLSMWQRPLMDYGKQDNKIYYGLWQKTV